MLSVDTRLVVCLILMKGCHLPYDRNQTKSSNQNQKKIFFYRYSGFPIWQPYPYPIAVRRVLVIALCLIPLMFVHHCIGGIVVSKSD